MSYKPKTTKEGLLHRLKIARGHMDKVIAMVEDNEYCIDIIHQSQAIQKALKQVDNITLENHLQSCVTDAISEGRNEEAISEVMQVFKKAY
jgi:DNA-binding FrmR family transcriptional regulator